MEGPVRLSLLFIVLFSICSVIGDIILQDQYDNCGSYDKPVEVRVTDRDEEFIYSHINEYYSPERNCMVTIIGKKQHQISLELTRIDIDGHVYSTDHCGGLCCNDYLKIFNSYRVDNARLLPGIGQWGLCGNELPRKTTFATTNNFVTVQFRSDELSDYKRGFVLKFRQYPWRNPGIYPDGGFYGGWNDGTRNELQVDWNEQSEVPGDFHPDKNPDFENTGGKTCYECIGCNVYNFYPDVEDTTTRGGCYVCSKAWRNEFQSAQRSCYTETEYFNLLLTLKDTSVGDGVVKDYRGCKNFLDRSGRNLNYCFCDTDKCNGGVSARYSSLIFVVSLIALWFINH